MLQSATRCSRLLQFCSLLCCATTLTTSCKQHSYWAMSLTTKVAKSVFEGIGMPSHCSFPSLIGFKFCVLFNFLFVLSGIGHFSISALLLNSIIRCCCAFDVSTLALFNLPGTQRCPCWKIWHQLLFVSSFYSFMLGLVNSDLRKASKNYKCNVTVS